MHTDKGSCRKLHFEGNWLTWVVLRHFLPAPLFRELAYVIVDRISDNALTLDQLFDETITDGLPCLDSWLVQPLETNSNLASYLQYRIRSLIWTSDSESPPFHQENSEKPHVISSEIFDMIVNLGAADLMSAKTLLEDIPDINQPSFIQFVAAFKATCVSWKSQNTEDFLTKLEPCIRSIEMPLVAVVTKHLGDLCADEDEWDKAQALYKIAICRLTDYEDPSWKDFIGLLNAIITQSLAAATLTIDGAEKAASFFTDFLGKTNLCDNPLLLANATYDAMVISMMGDYLKNRQPDRRATLLSPPLLHNTHEISGAVEPWLRADFSDAHRRFWAVLRRQTALGSAMESRKTKALYARSIIDDLDQNIARKRQPQSFYMAIRLLLESGDTKSVAQIRWNEQLIDIYVDEHCVDFVISHALAHAGSKLDRQLVAVELFRGWTEQISPARTDVATSMLKNIALLAREPLSFYENLNLGGRSLKALQSIAKKRPELRRSLEPEVATAIMEKLHSPESWRNSETAIETALEYMEIFPDETLGTIIKSTLSMLDQISPKAGLWPVVRPALNLLTSESVKCLSTKEPELGRRIVSTILHFGLQQDSENARLLFYLHNFDAALLRDDSIRNKLQDTVKKVRLRATVINSSNAVENIQALLLAPAVSGYDGVKDALTGLTRILESAKESHPSIALPFAYDTLLLLTVRQQQIAIDISVSLDEFRSWLQPLVPLVINLWAVAKNQPLVFAPFSFPPAVKPDSVIIHNWAFASAQFAKELGQVKEIQEVLTAATANPELSSGIYLARATRSAAGEDDNIDPGSIRAENRDTFYSALGRRLVLLQRLDAKLGIEVCKALLDQCLNLGPREIDAAVYLSAIRLNMSGYVTHASLSDYMKRLENSRDLRLTLAPILHIIKDDAE